MFAKYLAYALLASLVGGGAYVGYLQRRLKVAVRMLTEERTRQRSISASYGRITEQWFPLMEKYPYDSANFRFLGTPIDGVQFEEDKIVFVEFKSHKAELSTQQRRLKQMIQAGKVTWEEFHFSSEER
jgi:predicted Holliday junction resolvase-like endonuclease